MTILCIVHQGNTLGLDGNTPLPLNVHRIKNLRFHFTVCQAAAQMDKPICKRRLAMINVGNDGEITNVLWSYQCVGARALQSD